MCFVFVMAVSLIPVNAASKPSEYSNMSSSYKNGPYYTKLMNVTLTGNQAEDVVKVAYSQVGYHAGSSTSDLSGTSSAKSNYVEYFNLINPKLQNQNWCATFVSWCFREAGVPTSVMPSGTGVGTLRNSVKNNNATWHAVNSGYKPKKGDLVLYEQMDSNYKYYIPASRDSSGLPTVSSHVGIVVTDYDGKTCDTVQRKDSYTVKIDTIKNLYSAGPLKDGTLINRIQGFVTPNYSGHTHTASYKSKGYCESCKTWLPNQNNNASVKTGTYQFIADSPYNQLMSHPYQSAETYGKCYKVFKGGEFVNVIGAVINGGGNTWLKISYNGTTGYAFADRLKYHVHSDSYNSKGYCETCKTWKPNQNNNASVKTGSYQFKADSPYNQLMSHPYQAAETYGKCYRVFKGGEFVNVIGAVINGGGNTWLKISYNGTTGYAFADRLQYHTHTDNYNNIGYCETCKTWKPNQNNNANVKKGTYIFTADSPYNQLMSHPYQAAETYGKCYKVFKGGESVQVIGAVINGGGNTWLKISYDGVTGYAFADRLQYHTHSDSYNSKGYCETCKTWKPNQNDNVSVKTGLYEFTADSPYNQLMSHPYQVAETYGKCYKVFKGGEAVQVIGAVKNGGGNLWYKISYNGVTGYAFADRMKLHTHSYVDGICSGCGAVDPNYEGSELDPNQESPFEDVQKSDEYYDAVLWAYYSDPQITNGITATKFGPKNIVKRSECVTFLWRSVGCPEPNSKSNPFTDVKKDDYFYKAVLWAIENDITLGTSPTTFSPNKTLSTAHMITFLYRTKNPGEDGWYEEAADWAESGYSGKPFGVNTIVDDYTICPRGYVVMFLQKAQ